MTRPKEVPALFLTDDLFNKNAKIKKFNICRELQFVTGLHKIQFPNFQSAYILQGQNATEEVLWTLGTLGTSGPSSV